MTATLDKIRKLKERPKQEGQGGSRLNGIFHKWKVGDNYIRLVGSFTEVQTHFVAPVAARKERGLCRSDAFQGDGKIPQVINCPDWDVATESEKKTHTCPICKLNAIAHAVLQEQCTEEEKKSYEALRRSTRPVSKLKWNIIDRDDPFVTQQQDGNEVKVRGLKIADIGQEAWNDILGIFDQMAYDIADPKEGLDICVKRVEAERTKYSAQAVLDNTKRPPSAKMTPLTAEELAMKQHDLKVICGKQTDVKKIIDALHEDLRELLEINTQSAEAPAAEAPAAEPTADEPPADAALAAAVDEAVGGGDDDGMMSGVPVRSVKKPGAAPETAKKK